MSVQRGVQWGRWGVLVLIGVGVAPLRAETANGAKPPSIEDYARPPAVESVVVSPSGKRLALLSIGPSGYRRAAVMDLDPIGPPHVVAEFGNANVDHIQWVNDNRLVYTASKREAYLKEGAAGTFAVDHDGSGPKQLISYALDRRDAAGSHITARLLPYDWSLGSVIDEDGNDVFVHRTLYDNHRDPTEYQLARLDTVTGELRTLSYQMPKGTIHWWSNAKREPRMLSAYREGRVKMYWRTNPADAWSEVADFDPLREVGFTPRFVESDTRVLVSSRVSSDTEALYAFDPTTRRLDTEPLVKVPGFDLAPVPIVDRRSNHLVGLHLSADRRVSYWFDDAMAAIQKGVDGALPGRNNLLECSRCETARFVVVDSRSDRQPAEYYLYDRKDSSLARIAASRPWIDAATQGSRSFQRIKARDGLSIPLYVTSPAGAKPDEALPAVVLVHGGPWVRGATRDWNEEAQFLASRGYRVLEPEFRGSEGYGWTLFQAGWKQWGHAMQDDLVDAVKWAADKGLLDAKRVCVEGGSYGGYAALMAPIASPGVFRCAASFAGVTDIDLMYDLQWSDTSEQARQYSMPTLVGDQKADAALLAQASPLKRVAEIKIPILLAHGREDRRVPIEHARQFVAAARKAGVDLEFIDYPNEGHGFFHEEDQADYYRHLEAFLAKALKPTP